MTTGPSTNSLPRRLLEALPLYRKPPPPWDIIAAEAWQKSTFATARRSIAAQICRRADALEERQVKIHYGGARCTVHLTTSLGMAVYRYGFEDPDVELFYRLLGPGDCFLDAGAHIGLFSLIVASKVGPTGSVIAVEPAPLTHENLRANVEMNGYHWVELVPKALGASSGSAIMTAFIGDRSALTSLSPADEVDGRRELVQLDTIDNIVRQRGGGRITALKIDVEGSEWEVVKGALQTLQNWMPDVLIEVEPGHLARQGAAVEDLRACFVDLGYRSFRVAMGPTLIDDDGWSLPWRTPNLFLTVRPGDVRSRLAEALGPR